MTSWRGQVWYGWKHIQEPIIDSLAWESKEYLLDSEIESFGWEALEIIQAHQPVLLDPYSNLASGKAPAHISKDRAEKLMASIKGGLERDSHYLRCRVIQVLEAGNYLGLFRVELPRIPIPSLKMRVSPYHYPLFDSYLGRIPRLRSDFVESLSTVSPVDNESFWGQIFLSAMLFGGLTETSRILAIPAALRTKNSSDPIYWLDIPRDKHELGFGRHPTHRWIVDPLTRFLIVRSKGRSLGYSNVTGGQKSVRLKKAINSYLSLVPRVGHRIDDLREFQRQLGVAHYTRMPGYVAAYLRQSRSSYTLSDQAWERLLQPNRSIDHSLLIAQQKEEGNGHARLAVNTTAANSISLPVYHPDYLSLIACIEQSSDDVGRSVDVWRTSRSSPNITIDLLADWIVRWLTVHGAHQKRPLGRVGVLRRVERVGSLLVATLGDQDPRALTPDEHIDLFRLILEECDSNRERSYVASGLLSWHCFLSIKHQITEIDQADIREIVAELGAVDANLVTPHEFRLAEQWVYAESLQRYGDRLWSESLCMMMVFGFYLGLRRREVAGLMVDDVEGIEDLYLFVRPNQLRGLKTRNAKRMIPVSILIPDDYLMRFKLWLKSRREEVESTVPRDSDTFVLEYEQQKRVGQHLLFPCFSESTSCESGFRMIEEALKRSTHEALIHFHHLRHSFANWTLMRFALYELKKHDRGDLPSWFLPDPVDRSELMDMAGSVREELLGKAPTNRRSLVQITQLLGHASISITVRSYLHLLDMLSSLYVRRLAPTLSKKNLEALGVKVGGQRKSDGDAAKQLDVISDRLCMSWSGASSNPPYEKEPRLRGRPKPEDRLHVVSKSLLLLDEGRDLEEVSKAVGVQKKRVQLWKDRIGDSHFSRGIADQRLLKNKHYPTGHTILWLPRGEEQKRIAQGVSDRIAQLKSRGDPPQIKKQAAANRIGKALDVMVKQWVPGTALTVEVDKITDAKNWLWLLEKLELSAGLDIKLHCCRKSTGSWKRQEAYWSGVLEGRRYALEEGGEAVIRKNGQLRIRILSSAVYDNSSDPTLKVLEAVRLALLSEWIDR